MNMTMRYADENRAFRPLRSLALVVLCLLLGFTAVSCDSLPFGKKDKKKTTTEKKTPKGQQPAKGGQAAEGGDDVFGEYNEQLIAEANLDEFKAQVNTEVGRDNPFAVAPYGDVNQIDKDVMQENPDMYRVIGTVRTTPNGPAALIQLGEESFIVHERDEINNALIKQIKLREVIIEVNDNEIVLSMRTRKRTMPQETPGVNPEGLNQLAAMDDSITNMYNEYLNQKYGQGDFFEGERTDVPQSFPDYMRQQEENRYSNDEDSPFLR